MPVMKLIKIVTSRKTKQNKTKIDMKMNKMSKIKIFKSCCDYKYERNGFV